MDYDVNAIFQIAGLGVIVAMLHTICKQMGKEDFAQWVTLIGFIVVLFMVASYINRLFDQIQKTFLFM